MRLMKEGEQSERGESSGKKVTTYMCIVVYTLLIYNIVCIIYTNKVMQEIWFLNHLHLGWRRRRRPPYILFNKYVYFICTRDLNQLFDISLYICFYVYTCTICSICIENYVYMLRVNLARSRHVRNAIVK